MTQDPPTDDRWTELWNARKNGLSALFGPPSDMVYHATIPFQFRAQGGAADVLAFANHIPGMTYVTSELTGEDVGQQESSLGHYELAICSRSDLSQAAELISRLAAYTCDATLEPGETMDIGDFFGDSSIRALLFSTFGDAKRTFRLNDDSCGVLLCIGITTEELAFAMSHGTDKLLTLLKQKDVFPYTTPDRACVTTDAKLSFLTRFFKR